MKITKEYLKRVIKEELNKLEEQELLFPDKAGYAVADKNLVLKHLNPKSESFQDLQSAQGNAGFLQRGPYYAENFVWRPLDSQQEQLTKSVRSRDELRNILDNVLQKRPKHVAIPQTDFINLNGIEFFK